MTQFTCITLTKTWSSSKSQRPSLGYKILFELDNVAIVLIKLAMKIKILEKNTRMIFCSVSFLGDLEKYVSRRKHAYSSFLCIFSY